MLMLTESAPPSTVEKKSLTLRNWFAFERAALLLEVEVEGGRAALSSCTLQRYCLKLKLRMKVEKLGDDVAVTVLDCIPPVAETSEFVMLEMLKCCRRVFR